MSSSNMMSRYHDLMIRPVLTEKATMNMEERKYTFEVAKEATKPMIREAIERLYKVRVESVKTLTVKPKPKRRGVFVGKTRSWKKAIVKLVEGYTIPEFENLR